MNQEAWRTAANAVGTPAHHTPNGEFRNPWPTAQRPSHGFLRWQWDRLTHRLPPNPAPEQLPLARPDVARPYARPGELRATWVGHASFLLQLGGMNLLTDPHWSPRASPVPWAGPRRFVPPGVDWDALPPIDAVLLSHDHYDHLDDATVRRLHARFGEDLQWFAPLNYRAWFAERGIHRVIELDWWGEANLQTSAGGGQIMALPAQHWTSRTPWTRCERLWCSWAIRTPRHAVYFAGDTGWFPAFPDIGRQAGPFDLLLLPVGAYEPRWFMRPAHMNPEEAVRAYRELGGTGTLGGMHWGTFRLTDEDPLEPPERTRAAWAAAGLPPERLWIPRHGETRTVAAT